ncbi:MAG: thermonuclease family protein [Pseudomonadota bacterium]|nr:thermonuclease family protein [Pseudomonadota bacterium]
MSAALAAFLAPPAAADCPATDNARQVEVAHVIDGDTLVLASGDRVRLLGIDAPELGRDGAPNEPYAREARAELRRALQPNHAPALILSGSEPRDRHGRRLAHLYDWKGRNLSEHLLRRGLAYQAAVPPNLRFSDCYLAAEADARGWDLGLWRLPPLEASRLPAGLSGFERIEGEVRAVRPERGVTWIDLEGELKLRILDQDRHRFDPADLAALPGTRVEVRGWIYRYRGKPRIRLRHPSALRRL